MFIIISLANSTTLAENSEGGIPAPAAESLEPYCYMTRSGCMCFKVVYGYWKYGSKSFEPLFPMRWNSLTKLSNLKFSEICSWVGSDEFYDKWCNNPLTKLWPNKHTVIMLAID